jgi:outer membrane scaffolding protein for murein synthesis (MipA/OmpV family)
MESTLSLLSAIMAAFCLPASGRGRPTYFGFDAPETGSERRLPAGLSACAVTDRIIAQVERVNSGVASWVAILAAGFARDIASGSGNGWTDFIMLTIKALLWCLGTARSCLVGGPRRAYIGKFTACVLTMGVAGFASQAAAAPSPDASSVPTVAPDLGVSANQSPVSEALPPAQKWQVELGAGFVAGSKYPGSGQLSAAPVPFVSVTYEDRFFVSSREGIGGYVIQTPNFRLGASIGIADDVRYTGKDARLRGLPKIKTGGQASLFAAYDLGPIAIEAAVHERIGTVNGVSATLGATYRIQLTSDWSVMAGPELKVQSASLNDAFFGVTQAAALRAAAYGNKIGPYRPGVGLESVALTIASRYRLSEHWTLLARAGLGMLVGRDNDSPLTREQLQPEVGLFATYRF